ncbi:MAG TPA: zinc ABC transporter substrate-binding protein [Candidatus Acidoferrales bacterium]|nr:zinc ABC transporter substrate-binding protein [Candidatus Acidoferrales bacterium]
MLYYFKMASTAHIRRSPGGQLIIAWLFCLLTSGPVFAAPALRVAVGVPVLQTFVERIAGERAETLILQGSGDPHAFEPSARQMAALAGTQLYILAGLPFESAWLPRLRSINPSMKVVDLRAELPTRPLDGLGAADLQSSGAPDPHVWTDPAGAIKMVELIRDRLIELDPAGAANYRANSLKLNRDLDALESKIAAQLEPQRGRILLVFHPGWGYLADHHGLRQLPLEVSGREPGAAQLRDTLAIARRSGVSAVFLQPGHGDRIAQQVARELGVPLVLVDPLAADYFGNVRRLVQALASSPP